MMRTCPPMGGGLVLRTKSYVHDSKVKINIVINRCNAGESRDIYNFIIAT